MDKKLNWLRQTPKDHPPLTRGEEDASNAVSAFRRIYEYGSLHGYPSLMIFAAYKALQKLESAHDKIPYKSATDGECTRPDMTLPPWVLDGLWLVVESLAHPKNGKSQFALTSGAFPSNLAKLWSDYDCWYPIWKLVNQQNLKLNAAVVRLYGDPSVGQAGGRAYKRIEKLLSDLNSAPLSDELGKKLAPVQPRDLLATNHLRRALHFATP